MVAQSVTNSQGYSGPSPQRLEIHDDEDPPTVTLHLPGSISENNGTSRVTAQLSHPSSEPTTVTVDATAVHPTLDADFTITGTVLEITAGATRSTGTGATITAIDNITDAPDKEVTVSAGVVNTQGFEGGTPTDKTLTIVDDEAPPGVTLWLSKSAIAEATAQASVTATLTHPSSEATLVTITATPISPAVAADFNQNGTQVTIPPGLTASTGTVSVTAIDNDIDAADKRITISGAASNAKVPPPGVASNPTAVNLTIEDDDVRGITFDPATQVMVEGLVNNPNDAEYEVALTTEPTGTVTVTVTGTNALKIATASNPGSSDFGTSKTLSFSPSNWDTGQTVTLRASADGNTSNNTVRVGHRASGSDYGSVSENFSVSVLDANRQPVTLELSVDRTTVGEEDGTVLLNVTAALGGTGTTNEPEEYLVVISAAAGTASSDDFTANSSTFRIGGNHNYQGTFRTTNQIGLTVVNDGIDENDESVTITATAAPQNNGQPAATIVETSVTIKDDDTRGVTIAPPQIELDEGGSRGYTVKLDSQPTATVTVTPTKSGDGDITFTPPVLTFTDTTWDTAQTVIVEAAEDNDPLDDQATIRHDVAGGDYGANNVRAITVQATARDNDGRGVNVSTRDLTVAEGATETYTVWLNSQPTGTVRISPRVSGDGDVTARPRELSFTAATWETPQTVTVEAATDPDIDDDRASITHGVSGADYGASNVPGPEILVRATDSGATTSTGTMTVSHGTVREGSRTRAFMITATLDGTRAMQTVVTVVVRGGTASANDFEATPSAFQLRIASGQTSARQSIRLDASGDSTAETDETIIVEGTAPGLTFRSAETTIIDDDQAGIVVSKTAITVREQDPGQSYTVKLRSAPDSTVTVTATVEGENEVTATPSQLTFTAANWNRAQTVRVRAGADPDGDHEEAKITHQAKGGDYEGRRGETITVTVSDDDEGSRRVALSLSVERIGEGAGAQTLSLTATLDGAQRSIDTAVNVTVGGGTAEESTDYTADSGFTITIPEGQLTATGTFNFTPVDDGIDEGNETVNVGATATGLAVTGTTIVIVDNDDRGVTASLAVMTVNEGGTNTYTVVLDTQPTGEVTVRPTVSGDSDVSVRPASVTFTTRSWSTAQTFTVSAAHDEDAADDSASISHRASGADYAQVRIEDVTVTVRDGDMRGVTLSTNALELREGREESYTIVLDTRPTGTVTIRPTLSEDSDADVRARPSTLRFTTASWNTAQTITVSANQDGDSAPDSATINHVVAGADYDGTTAGQVSVTVSDDDVPSTAIVLQVSHDTVAESTPRQVTVTAELNASPQSTDTVVTLTLEADSAQTEDFNAIAPVELVIIAGRTSATAQVRIAPIDDAIDEVAEETLRIATATTSGLALSPSTGFTISIEDDDVAGITLSRAALTVREEGSASYTIRLNSQPTQSVEIDIGTTGNNRSALRVTPYTMQFTESNWSTPRTITVEASEDPDGDDGDAQINHEADAAEYAGIAAVLPVTITDIDEASQRVALTLDNDQIDEDGGRQTIKMTATLDGAGRSQDTHIDVRVVAGTATEGVDFAEITGARITIPQGRTSGEQRVRFTPVNDDIDEGFSETVIFAGTTAGLTVGQTRLSIIDDDGRGIEVPEGAVRLTEEDESGGNYHVVLATKPTGTVTIRITVSGNTQVTVEPTSLVFTSASWNTAQRVTVRSAHDDNAGEDTATLHHEASGADYAGVSARPVRVEIEDNDYRRITFTPPTRIELREGGQTTYTAVLETLPTGTVRVELAFEPNSDSDITLAPAVLRFTPTNWNIPQEVTVSAAQDSDHNADSARIRHTISGADYGRAQVRVRDMKVRVTDDDTASTAVVVKLSTDTVAEHDAGAQITLTAELDGAARGEDIEIEISLLQSSDAEEDVDFRANQEILTIAAGRTSTTGRIAIRPIDDEIDEGESESMVLHIQTWPRLEVRPGPVLGIWIEDDDEAGFVLSRNALTVREEGTASYTVRLDSEPTGTCQRL